MYESGIIYYNGKIRIGRIQMSRTCFHRMQRNGITTDELEEAFRYSREVEEGKIEYGEIRLFFAQDFTRITRGNLDQERFVVITCWKGGEKNV